MFFSGMVSYDMAEYGLLEIIAISTVPPTCSGRHMAEMTVIDSIHCYFQYGTSMWYFFDGLSLNFF